MKKFIIIPFLLSLIFPLSSINSQTNGTCRWTGAIDSNWSTATNWSDCSGSYPSGTNAIAQVIIPSGSSETINVDQDIVLKQLNIHSSSQQGTLTFSNSSNSSIRFNGANVAVIASNKGGVDVIFNVDIEVTKGNFAREIIVGKEWMSTASTMTFSEGYTITHNDEIEFLFIANSDTQVTDAVQHELFLNGTVVTTTYVNDEGATTQSYRDIEFLDEHKVTIGANADFSNFKGDIIISGANPGGITVNGHLQTRGLKMSGASNVTINTTGGITATGNTQTGSGSGNEVETTGSGKIIINSSNTSSGFFIAKSAHLSNTININFKKPLDYQNASGTEWTLIGIPVAGETVNDLEAQNVLATNTVGGVSKIGLGTFNNATGAWTTFDSGSTDALEQMKGYHVTPSGFGETIEIQGTLLTSNGYNTIEVNMESGTHGNWAIVGNPFPSYLRMTDDATGVDSGVTTSDFLSDNIGSSVDDSSFAAVYAWDGEQYVPYTQSTNSKNYIAPGEGFFVYLKDGQSSRNVRFREGYQISGVQGANFNAGLAKGDNEEEKIIVELGIRSSNGNQSDRTKLFFSKNATTGLDPGQDLGKFPFGSGTYISTKLVNGDNKDINYMWQDLPKNQINNLIIPLNISSKQNELILSINQSNLSELTNLFIEDKQNNTIKKFEKNLRIEYDPNEDQSNRFYLHLTDQLIPELPTDDNLRIYKGSDSDVMVMGAVGKNYSAKVYDYSGRLIKEVNFNHKTKINDLDSKMKILRIESEEGLTIKKFKLN